MFKPTPLPSTLTAFALCALLTACGGTHTDPARTLAAPAAAPLAAAPLQSFANNRNAYTISHTSSGFSVKDTASGVSTTVAADATSLAFADMNVNLQVGDKANALAAADLQSIVELYIAYFNRVPDGDGMAYWLAQRQAGMSIAQISSAFYNAAISPAYSALTGYSSSMSNADFIKIIYKNVLGRTEVDAGGMNYWSTALANGSETRDSLIKSILSAAHTFKGDPTYGYVADLLDNKFAVGKFFAVEQGLNYKTAEQSYTKGVQIAAAITPQSTAAAKSLIGVSDSGFNLMQLPPDLLAVTGVTLDQNTYRSTAHITVSGQNLDRGIVPTLPACLNLHEETGGTAVKRVFSCKLIGVGNFTLNIASSNGAQALYSWPVSVGLNALPQVTMSTNLGSVVIELNPLKAPITVDNFLNYVETGFYSNKIFHRVISTFMVQGGGYGTDLVEAATAAPIPLETPNGLSNLRGSIAMARTSVPDSATAQFYINVVDNLFLDATSAKTGYAVFGQVVSGMNVVDQIRSAPTISVGPFTDLPASPILIQSMTRTR